MATMCQTCLSYRCRCEPTEYEIVPPEVVETLTLFAYPTAPPSNGTETSDAAAASLTQAELNDRQKRVLAAIWNHRETGLTDQQIEDVTGLSGNTVRPRRGELEQGGWIETRCVDGHAVKRATRSGFAAIVWFPTRQMERAVESYRTFRKGAA